MRTTPLIYPLFLFSIAAFTLLMFSKVIPYLSFEPEIGFLITKTNAVLRKKSFTTAFYVHILSSAWIMAIGIFQFIPLFLKKYPNWYRFLGKIYVFSMLVFAAPSGLVYRILCQRWSPCKKMRNSGMTTPQFNKISRTFLVTFALTQNHNFIIHSQISHGNFNINGSFRNARETQIP